MTPRFARITCRKTRSADPSPRRPGPFTVIPAAIDDAANPPKPKGGEEDLTPADIEQREQQANEEAGLRTEDEP